MKSNSVGATLFLSLIYSSIANEFNVTPKVTVVETSRRTMGMGLMLPEGSPWCENGNPMYWFMGHLNPESWHCETSPGVFERVVPDFGENFDRHGCTAFDVDQDGILDIMCTRGGQKGTATEKENVVYLTQSNGTFVQIYNHGMESNTRRSKDFIGFKASNGDDLVFEAVHASPRDDGLPNDNTLYKRIKEREDDGPYFEEMEGPWDNKTYYIKTVIPGDFNGDNATDIFTFGRQLLRPVRNQYYTMKIYQQLKRPGEFKDICLVERWKASYNFSAATAHDLNGDGLPDLVAYDQRTKRFFVYYNRSTGRDVKFIRGRLPREKPRRYDIHHYVRDIRVLDVNGDGLMDIYVSQSRNDRNVYCDTHVKGGYPKVQEQYGIEPYGEYNQEVFTFEPPIDPMPDILFIQKERDGTKYPRFKRHELRLGLRGCAGVLKPYGEQKLAVSYSFLQWPGYQYLLDWSNN